MMFAKVYLLIITTTIMMFAKVYLFSDYPQQKKNELKEVLVTELIEKRKLIETEKSSLELTGGVGLILPMDVKPVVTRKLRRRPNDPPPVTEKKRKTASAQLNFLLNEEQIISDMKRINKHYKHPVEEKTVAKTIGTSLN